MTPPAMRHLHLLAHELAPFAAGLRALEDAISYPLDRDRFTIDHGPDYHPFFSGLGEAHFLLALDGDRVVATLCGMLRPVRARGQTHLGLYLGDYKVAPSHRGTGVGLGLLHYGLGQLLADPRRSALRCLYGAAMRGPHGDVMRTRKAWLHPGWIVRPAARMRLWFADPRALARVDPRLCPPPPDHDGWDLSPHDPAAPTLVCTAGRKDLRLVSTGAPLPLVHLAGGPSVWGASWGHWLRRAGEALADTRPEAQACFALDARLHGHHTWIAAQGLCPDAECTVYALARGMGAGPWVHLSTCDI